MRVSHFLKTKLLFLAGAFLFLCCQEKPDSVPTPNTDIVQSDSTLASKDSLASITVIADADYPLRRLDAFFYESTGERKLLEHIRLQGAEVSLPCAAMVDVYVIANAAGSFNDEALRHYDSLLRLGYSLDYEDPRFPLMSGLVKAAKGSTVHVSLTPLLCTVQLGQVSNYRQDIAMNPRVRLENISTQAEIFRDAGFPLLETRNSDWVFLPSDIGFLAQYPGTALYCYPNDLPGSSPTTVIFECEIDGQTRTQRIPIYPMERGSTTLTDISVQ